MKGQVAKNIYIIIACCLLVASIVLAIVLTNTEADAYNSSYTESSNAVVVSEILMQPILQN